MLLQVELAGVLAAAVKRWPIRASKLCLTQSSRGGTRGRSTARMSWGFSRCCAARASWGFSRCCAALLDRGCTRGRSPVLSGRGGTRGRSTVLSGRGRRDFHRLVGHGHAALCLGCAATLNF